MAAEDIIKTGSIADTMAALTDQIRKNPADPRLAFSYSKCIASKVLGKKH